MKEKISMEYGKRILTVKTLFLSSFVYFLNKDTGDCITRIFPNWGMFSHVTGRVWANFIVYNKYLMTGPKGTLRSRGNKTHCFAWAPKLHHAQNLPYVS